MRVLILGGTGAMGVHTSKLLTQMGHHVTVTSRSRHDSDTPNLTYRTGNAKDQGFLHELLAERWDAIVDFMVWSTPEFRQRIVALLKATAQYLFVSSYRVYADSPVIRESSPRLLDVIDDPDYLATDEYALAKARCENMLFESGKTNWTIIRPAVTYDGGGRFQLAVYEAGTWLWRAEHRIPVPLPSLILAKQGTMTWGGDVALMLSLLIGNERALGEAFTASTAEHMSWRAIAEVYEQIVPLKITDCSMQQFEWAHGAKYQIRYDRMYDRIIDNSKVLSVTGLHQKQLTPIREGLEGQLNAYLQKHHDGGIAFDGPGRQGRFDRLVGGVPSLGAVSGYGAMSSVKYLVRRFL